MKKSTKGALAAGAAAVLLLGGGGSLAYWTATGTVDGGSFDTGTLGLTADDCSTAAWTYATPGHVGEAVTLVVPGDSIQKDCTFTVAATGDHLAATADAPGTVDVTPTPAAPTVQATVAATYDIGGTALPPGGTITSANDGQTLTAHLVVTFPYGDGSTIDFNDTQNINAALSALTVTLTQTDPGA